MVDVQVEKQSLVPEVQIAIDRKRAAEYGVQVGEVNAVAGNRAARDDRFRRSLTGSASTTQSCAWMSHIAIDMEAMSNILIDTPSGGKIPVRNVADIKMGYSPNQVWRENAQRRIVVQANLAGRDLQGAVHDLQERISQRVQLPSEYYISYGGQFESEQNATRLILILSIFAIIGIFVLLYAHFGFVRVALQIMSNLPLALVGGVDRGIPQRRRVIRRVHDRLHYRHGHRGAERHHDDLALHPSGGVRGRAVR